MDGRSQSGDEDHRSRVGGDFRTDKLKGKNLLCFYRIKSDGEGIRAVVA